jgi:Large polyvalent protein associated domain 38/Large polyvalent protein-associated domain 5/ADP-Ribosyltransferase in polyvalent proteins/Large polyvalent protein-associated domain 1
MTTLGPKATLCLKAATNLGPEDTARFVELFDTYSAAGLSQGQAAQRAASDLVAEIRSEGESLLQSLGALTTKPVEHPAGKALRAKSHPAAVRGSVPLAEISRALGGLSPALLPDLSQKVNRTRMSKLGSKTQYVVWDNPPVPGVGPLFRVGGTGDLGEVARVLEEAGYLTQGTTDADGVAAGNQAADIIRAELARGGSTLRVGDADAIEAEARRRADEAMGEPEQDPWDSFSFTPDDLDESGYSGASDEVRAAVEQLLQQAESAGVDTETIREDVARSLGADATDEAYHDAIRQALQQAIDQGRIGPADTGAAQAGGGDRGQAAEQAGGARGKGRQGGPDQEGLTLSAQTPDDLKAKAEREAAARRADEAEQQRLERKARADAQRDEFSLTGSDRAADVAAAAGQGDIFAEQPAAPTQAAPLDAALAGAKDVAGMVDWLAKNSDSPSYRAIAQRIAPLVGKVELIVVTSGKDVPGGVPTALNIAKGVFYENFKTGRRAVFVKDRSFKENGISEETLLHEAIHAATNEALRQGNMRKNAGMPVHAAVQELYDLQHKIVADLKARQAAGTLSAFEKQMHVQMAASNVAEVLAWGLTDADFQTMLRGIRVDGRSGWSKFVAAVRKMLGLGSESNDALSELLTVSDKILAAQEGGDALTKTTDRVTEVAAPAWHTPIPAKGLAVQPGDEKPDSARSIVWRVAEDAAKAITPTQKLNGSPLYAYLLPSTETEHGVVRLLPDDQTAPAGWKLLFPEALRFGMMSPDQVAAKLRDALGREPILASGPAPAVAVAKKKPAQAKKPAEIEDFGEKLAGAKKDYATTLKDAMEVDVASEPLSKSWPEPDYQKLLDGGADPFMVAFIHAARDEVPTKPQKGWKLKGWVDSVTALRSMSQLMLSGNFDSAEVKKVMARAKFDNVTRYVGGRAELYQAVGHERSLKGVTFTHNHYSLYRGRSNVDLWVVEQKTKANVFGNWPREIATGDTKEAALAAFKEKVDTLNPKERQTSYDIYRKRNVDGYFIGKKIGREYVDLKKVADVKEARAFLAEHRDQLDAALAKYKDTPFERSAENAPRVGGDHRLSHAGIGQIVQSLVDRSKADAKRISDALVAPSSQSKASGSGQIPLEPALSLGPGDMNTILDKNLPYMASVASEVLRNLNDAGSLSVEGFSRLNAPARRIVQASMLALGHDPKIRRGVVQLVPVDVVNLLASENRSADDLLGNRAMLGNLLSVNDDPSVRTPNAGVLQLARAIARSATEGAVREQVTGVALKDDPAVRAGQFNSISGQGPFGQVNVSPEDFHETFSFRGVQFGNYVEQGRRQSDLNQAFDALMDMAAVLNLPPRALSLNGQLGLAFGARGSGGKNAAAAHFEPGQVVINLTKGNGPGSLAHEWWHAADNYFARNFGGSGFVTGGDRADQLRMEMQKAFKTVQMATQAASLRKRSQELDKRRSKPYWNTTLELSARSFEAYIIAKLQDQSAANGYLANVVDQKVWDTLDAMRGVDADNPATYPYPNVDEIPAVRAAFDEFFKTVQTRQDDAGNVAMFSMGKSLPATIEIDGQQRSTTNSKGQQIAQTEEGVRNFWKWFGDSKVVDADGNPLVVYHGTDNDIEAFDRGKLGSTTGAASAKMGFFFTPDPVVASSYVTNTGRVYPVYLHAESVKEADYEGAFYREISYAEVISDASSTPDQRRDKIRAKYDLAPKPGQRARSAASYSKQQAAADAHIARTEGLDEKYDGVVLRNTFDPGMTDRQAAKVKTDIWVVFDPKQIKSAIGNTGTFDPGNPDIRFGINARPANSAAAQAKARVQDTTTKITEGWSNAPSVRVIGSMDEAPQEVRAAADERRDSGAAGSPEGFWHNGTVYLVAEQLPSDADVTRVLFHEALGHAGLRGVFGSSLNTVLDTFAQAMPVKVAAKAAEYGLDMRDLEQRRQAAEEALAEIAQTRPKLGSVQRLIAAIRTWLRENLPGLGIKMSDTEVLRNFIEPARGWVERGRAAAAAGDAAFSLASDKQKAIAAQKALDAAESVGPDEWAAAADASFEAQQAFADKLAAIPDDSFALSGELRGRMTTVNPSAQNPGQYQVTRFDTKGEPWSDAQHFTKRQAIDDFLQSVDLASAQDSGGAALGGARFSLGQSLADRVRNYGGGEKIVGETGRQYTQDQLAAMRHVGAAVQIPTLEERAKALWKDAGKKLAQGLVDQFAPVKELSGKAYSLLRLSKGASGAFETLLQGGKLKLSDGVYDFDESAKGGVVETLLKPLGGEHHDFFRWIAANRAERLMSDGKENLFTAQDIAALKTLADGTTSFAYTIRNGANAGQVTRDRTLIYADALRTFNGFNKNVLDMAEQSGLIDGESRAIWEHDFYVPFYRVSNDEDGGIAGANVKSGMVRQQAFKELKGGANALNNDLLDNTLMNWAHLIDASAKNRAAVETLAAAERMGVAMSAPEDTARQMASSVGKKSNVVWAMDQGRKHFYVVDDPYVMTALSALEFAGMKGPAMKVMGAFKHALTVGVTASPFFKIRNLIRDSVQVIGTSNIDVNPLRNLSSGWKLTDPKNDAYFRLLAGGGTIHFGTMMEGSEAKRVQALVEAGVDAGTVLNSAGKLKAFYRKVIEPTVTAYNELGNRGEAVNRAALYDQLIKQGKSHAEASLMARDLMDFSMQGSFTSVRFLTQIVPFFNARIQGLYKLGRAAKEDPARFSAVVGVTTLASLGLLMAFGDDDDWKKREEWDRNNFWWFKIGGTAYRIPKPFEIGAVATLAERGFELAFDKEMTGKRFRQQVMTLLGDNLSMNPVPQLVKPMLDVYANIDSFSGRPIESMGMEKLKADYRFTGTTSMAARGISTAANAVTGLVDKETLSPLQVDHLLRGYFGWLGTFVIGAGDVLARPATGQADRPSSDMWKEATGGMVSDLRDAPSRYVSQMYRQAQELEEAHNTWKMLVKQGKVEEATDFAAENRPQLMKFQMIEHLKASTAKINQRIKAVEQGDASGDQKREQIRSLQEQRDRLARRLATI